MTGPGPADVPEGVNANDFLVATVVGQKDQIVLMRPPGPIPGDVALLLAAHLVAAADPFRHVDFMEMVDAARGVKPPGV